MKQFKILESVSILEIIVIFVFLVFIILPVNPTKEVSLFLDSSLGMVVLFVVTIYLFIGANPILGVLFIFVAYELLRRSAAQSHGVPVIRQPIIVTQGQGQDPEHVPLIKEGGQPVLKQKEKDQQLLALNPQRTLTLEEEIISEYGPIEKGQPKIYEPPSYGPIVSSKLSAARF